MTSQRTPNAPRARALALLGGGFVVIVAAVLGILFVGGEDSAPVEAQGETAPEIALAYLDGDTTTLAALEGTPVVINFFADWCPACVAEMPDFERVHQAFGDRVAFIGMDRSLSIDGTRGLIDATGITYDVALDADGSIFQAFGGIAMPTTVFIAADGSLVAQHNGVIFEQDLTDQINDLFFGT